MTSVQLRSLPSAPSTPPDGPAAQNAVALFIFTIPMGTLSQDLFVNPIYRSVRNTIAKRCHCEMAVFDGNTMLQRAHSGPKSVRSRIRNANGNASMGCDVSQTCVSLLINITNTHEQVLFARGNWLIQVNYLTEPSEHHLFLKLVNDFATRLNSSGRFKRGAGSPLISQGFKCTTLVAITHEKLRQIWQSNHLLSLEQQQPKQQQEGVLGEKKPQNQPSAYQKHQKPFLALKNPNLPREWGEFPTLEPFESIEDLQINPTNQKMVEENKRTPTVILFQDKIEGTIDMFGKPWQEKALNQESDNGRIRLAEIASLLRPADHNANHHIPEEMTLNCIECAHHLNALEAEDMEEEKEEDEIEALFKEEFKSKHTCTLEQEVEDSDSLVDMECN
ncbi:unnamed protein product [Hydatigera taeniaeformis]|uniref:Uncharacterized protein n=1 Tax=Hydatigena taeniaeformis TaxID=6205 RepID=A0A0R3WKX3_HYDTA|nr:unnamed protein product [Hydatigera taeniaeformis]